MSFPITSGRLLNEAEVKNRLRFGTANIKTVFHSTIFFDKKYVYFSPFYHDMAGCHSERSEESRKTTILFPASYPAALNNGALPTQPFEMRPAI